MSNSNYSSGDDRRYNIGNLQGFGRNSWLVVILVIILVLAASIYATGIARVPAGSRGVLLTWGKVEDNILGEGLNFIMPFAQSVEMISVQVQKAESTESAATKDLQDVSATVAVNYRVYPDKVNKVYQEIGKEYVSQVIKPNIEESLKAATAQFTAEELITLRPQIKSIFDTILAERLNLFNIEVIAVSLTDFQFSPSFTQAIENKVIAEQAALEAVNKLEQIRTEAQQQIIQAEAARNATIVRSEGEAKAVIIAADATSEAMEVITSQMTPEYAQYLWLTQWDGKLPLVVGEGEGIILDLTSLADNDP